MREVHAPQNGRPSLTPGIYFRSLLIGYSKGIDSERGIAWRFGGLAGAASVCGDRAGRVHARPLDDFAHAAADRCGYPSGSVRLGAGGAGRSGTAEGSADRHRCHDAGSQRGDAGDRAARHGREDSTRSFCADWRRLPDACGGILSSVLDMAKWDAALYTDRLLKKSTLQQMWTPVRLNDGMLWRYGFGWDVGRINDHLIVSHEGNTPGFSSSIYRAVDDKLTVIILDNRFCSDDAAVWLAQKIARIYLWTGPDYRPIPDTEPKIIARVRDIIDRGDRGRLRAADFTPAVWAELSPWRKQMQDDGRKFGPALSLILVECDTEPDGRSYRYRVQYKFGSVLLHVVIDKRNKIAVWKVEDVDLK